MMVAPREDYPATRPQSSATTLHIASALLAARHRHSRPANVHSNAGPESRQNFCMGGRYSIELFREGGEGAGVDQVLARYENLTIARACLRANIKRYPDRLIILCDRFRVIARSDGPETTPSTL
jgi:hypothetical protein